MQGFVGRTLLGRYQITDFLGQGGMAHVHKAWDVQRAVYVAIKMLNSDLAEDFVFLRRFTREAEALKHLAHPHIVRFLDFEQFGNMAFLVTEYIDGVTLRGYLHRIGRAMTVAEALSILQPVCSALYYAHQKGIYHCDIKPANIFIENGGRVVLGDFGIAKLTEAPTVTFSTPGTPAYMSPEQCQGTIELDGRSDLYSLAVTTYEMLSLDRPFKGDSPQTTGSRSERIRWEHLYTAPMPVHLIAPQVPLVISQVLMQALAKQREARQPTVMSFYADMQRVAAVPLAKLSLAFGQLDAFPSTKKQPNLPIAQPIQQGGASTPPLHQRLTSPVLASVIILAGILVLILGLVVGKLMTDKPLLATITTTATNTFQPIPIGEKTALPGFFAEATKDPEGKLPTPVSTVIAMESDYYVMYIVNVSDGMRGTFDNSYAIDVIGAGMHNHLSLQRMPYNAGLILFGHRVHLRNREGSCSASNVELAVPMQVATDDQIVAQLERTDFEPGRAPLYEALAAAYDACSQVPRARPKAFILIDGFSGSCDETPLGLVRIKRDVIDVPIYIAALTPDSEREALLTALASESGGSYAEVADLRELTETLNRFLTAIVLD